MFDDDDDTCVWLLMFQRRIHMELLLPHSPLFLSSSLIGIHSIYFIEFYQCINRTILKKLIFHPAKRNSLEDWQHTFTLTWPSTIQCDSILILIRIEFGLNFIPFHSWQNKHADHWTINHIPFFLLLLLPNETRTKRRTYEFMWNALLEMKGKTESKFSSFFSLFLMHLLIILDYFFSFFFHP